MNPEALLRNADAMSAEQSALIGALLEERGAEFGAFPLSFTQERLWFLDRLSPGEPAYNIAGSIELRGTLDRASLWMALREVVDRHEILRTVFLAFHGRPVQVVREAAELALAEVDLSLLPAARRAEIGARLARQQAELPFDLARGPLLRALLLIGGPDEHELVLVLHHVVSDGWSSRLLAAELAALYGAFRSGLPSPLPELPLQFADFALWQRESLQGEALGRLLSAARARLGEPPSLELPADHRRPAEQTLRGRRLPWSLDPSLTMALRRLGEREGATPFAVLAAAFAALLGRWSGQTDLLLAFPSANRDRLELEPLVGCFINTLVLRADLSGEPGFRELIRRARLDGLAALALRELPFEKLVEELASSRSLSRAPLVQVMLALQNVELDLTLPGLDLRLAEIDNGTSKLDLTLALFEAGGGLRGWLEYSTDLFEGATAQRLLGHLERLLEGGLAEPERRFWDLALLSPAEAQQTLREWSDAEPLAVEPVCLHELFAAQALRTPEAVALVVGEERLTYRELALRSRGVASRLRAMGVGPETLVGIFLSRSSWLVAALLGILESGGAYVPLDPAYPRERVAATLADSGARVVVTEAELEGQLPALGFATLRVDSAAMPALPTLETAVARDAATPSNLAYVIYTSGSTGRPKGVAIEHRSAVSLLRWAWSEYGAEETARVLAGTSICFDLSVFELFVPLCRGGAVVLGETALSLPSLAARHEVTLVNTVPSALSELVSQGGIPPSVRVVNLAGEPLRRSLVDRLAAVPGVERILNLYGPSEDTTYSTWVEVPLGTGREPTIGRGLPGTALRVLGPGGSPAPIGVPGELCLGGAGLARGYLGRPELTAERFVPDAWSEAPGARLYRTGDLVRSLPDGELEFLGRLDHQVKVRGFRIELGEVEAALEGCPFVREAVALAREDGGGERRLVGYVVAEAGCEVSLATLRPLLVERLPEFMIPSALVVLSELPRTPNGKVDRRALPEPGEDSERTGVRAPRGPVEELLASIWSDVLRVDRVGSDDDFFALGGHSLQAVRVLARVRDLFSVDLPVRRIFEQPTLARLAASIEGERGARWDPLPIALIARGVPLPLSFGQERLWFLDRLSPGDPTFNIPVVLAIRGPLDLDRLMDAFGVSVRRHETLRTRFDLLDGRVVQIVDERRDVASSRIDLRHLSRPEALRAAEEVARELSAAPFDLTRDPLLRLAVVQLARDEVRIVVTLHHIAADAWSLGVLFAEVAESYRSLVEGRIPALPGLRVQYADYAAWQREALAPRLSELAESWRSRLAGLPEQTDLPTDRPRTPTRSSGGAEREVILPRPLAERLRARARAESATPFMALFAAWGALLARFGGQSDLAVGVPGATRPRAELEPLVGFFVNPLALRADLTGEPGFGELVRRARRMSLDAFAHQDLPFERLVQEVDPRRSLDRSPLFQTMLVLQNAPLPAFELPGVSVDVQRVESRTSKLDLTLALFEAGGGLRGWLEYSTDLFEGATAQRLLGHLERLLEGGLAEPERRFWDLALLSPAEAQQTLREWSDAEPLAVEPVCLHELFAAQALRTPEAVALVVGEERLTYRELALRSRGVAARLRALGVGPETLVGVFLSRSSWLVAALLGILESGGAYVPLDPAYPRERVAATLADSGARVVVTEAELEGRLPALGFATLLVDSPPMSELPTMETAVARGAVTPSNLAYVIYTSGSTGRPKGVAIEHRSAVSLLRWAWSEYSAEETARVLAGTSICFDLSVFELFVPLCRGGAVVLGETALSLPSLAARHEVTLVNTVPSALSELVSQGGIPPSVRVVNLAGEPLRRSLVDRLAAVPSVKRILNLYGPSEDTTYSTWVEVPLGTGREPTIGRGLPGTALRVLGPGGSPAPIGVPGELCLGGAGLARGYLGRPELTAERFVPDAWSEGSAAPGARLYRTGDLVRSLPDGELEFLGRLDHQVKVRGFRIELGEVEAALEGCPFVREAVALAREDGGGERRLVGYVVAEERREVSLVTLRPLLLERLPEFMIPSALVVLPELPRTPNGKVDRRALPEPGDDSERSGVRAPRGPVEELLASIWSDVLRVDRVGSDDDFFALGGHSLQAVRVLARIRDLFSVDLPVRRIFEQPTLARLAASIEAARREGEPARQPIVRAARPDLLPLSHAQRRLWFLDRLHPYDPAYTVPLWLRLEGALDLPALERALAALLERHEALRTRYIDVAGEPFQVVMEPPALALPIVDLAALPGELGVRIAGLLARELTAIPFDLAAGPVLRLAVMRLAERTHDLVGALHHIACDEWSLGVLVRDLESLYRGQTGESPAPLAALPIQYADYALWQRRWLLEPERERQLAWWRERLEGDAVQLELPTDRPRGVRGDDAAAILKLDLRDEDASALRALGRSEGATPFMVLLTAFQALLARWSGGEDISIGTPVAGRDRLETEEVVGLFVNTLVLRADLSGDPDFRCALRRSRSDVLEAFGRQELPFDLLVSELAGGLRGERAPLFQVFFSLQRPVIGSSFAGLAAVPLELAADSAKFDFSLAFEERDRAFHGRFEYRPALFDGATVARVGRHFEALLTQLVADPEARISAIELLSRPERQQLTIEAQGDLATREPSLYAHERIAEQAALRPQAVAVALGGETLSFRELERRSNALAAGLRALGVGQEALVGLYCGRSLEMIVGIVGILKAGGAYVPLDPAYPAARIAFMLEDAASPVVVAQRALRSALPPFSGAVVCLEDERPERPEMGATTLPTDPDAAAYVIYTSGSTNRPKGVVISHRALASYTEVAAEAFALTAEDRVLQFASISFDASVEEIFPALGCGATLVLRSESMMGSVAGLLAACGDAGVTVADLPASFWHEMAAEVEGDPLLLPSSLRLVILGSERVLPRRVTAWRRSVGPRVRLINTYGPTEATVVAAMADLTGALGEIEAGREAPIGRAIRDAEVRVVDRHLSLLPVSVPGELLLGGVGLARGYLGRPELTAERFIPDPWSRVPGSRLYRTGDRVLSRPDGQLEFIGRLDQQVKVRGYRIELGEVETALTGLPGVREAAAAVSEVAEGDRRLVAYVVGEVDEADLRRALLARLPEYMVPSAFVLLDALPLTPNGKVDRRALPTPEWSSPGEYLGPRTVVEELLAGIWSSVLGVKRVGREDHFFALGGHSLLAIQVVSRVRQVLGIELPVRRLFESPTLAGLAEKIEAARLPSAEELPPLVRRSPEATAQPSFAQERLWFLEQLEPGSGAYNIPGALRLEGELDVAALEGALSAIVRRHEALRTVFPSESGRPVATVLDETPLLWQIDLSSIAEREGEALRLARSEAERPFDLSWGPLVRFGLLRLAEREHVLLLTLHHINADGWSLGVWVKELGALYEAFAAGRPSPLAELPNQYSDFAAWQRSWLQGPVLERQVSYWRENLSDLDGDLDLPSDRPRPLTPSYRGGGERVSLDRALVERLEDLGRRTGSTLFMTLLGSWQALLHRWSGRSRFAVGTPVAGRTRVETEGLIGLFVNTLALRAEVEGDPRFGTLLERVREGSLSAFEHQDLPFEKVVEALSPERAMSRSPLFQVMFVLQTAPRPELSVSGMRLSGLALESTRAKFDLTLSLTPEASGVSGVLEFSRDLYDRSTVARLVASWLELLDAAVGDPDLRLSELPLLSDGQRHQLQVEWNGTPSPAGQPLCLHEPFTAQAGRTPEAEAIWFAGESLSYGELESRSNRLAHRLRASGVGPEVRVGVCLERTPALVVSLLAVLKAGGAYVPLDPRYPQTRLELMLEDSGARLAMVEEATLERLSAWSGERLVVSVRDMEEGPAHPVSSGVSPRNLAYLIYTSGSTGRPKGVAIEHASAWALTMWARESFPSDCWSGVLASTSVCFDLSVFEIFVPLAWGGRLVLASDALELGGLAGAGVRLVNTVPSAMSELERLGALPASVRVVNLAGEPLKRGLAEALYARGVEQVWNLYGPSEDTTYSTASRVAAGAAGDVGAPTIGRPLPGTRSYVADRDLEPVPLGASGELLLGGVGLARGYLGRPELTAERFVPDLWSGVAGARLYRTGDRVRYRTDGELEFIGRLDQQVKVRGFRIELGEIESVLEELPEVREAVVVVREETSGDRRLVAYVVGDASAADLRRTLLARLPEHMVPSAFVLLDALPLTPNGKVDRRSLPAPERSAEGESVAPRTVVEELLAGIWSSVLGLDRVGRDDHFFALGGHSLLAVQVVARVRQILGVELGVRRLFESPTLGALAERIEEARGLSPDGQPPLERRASKASFPPSFAQERLWFLEQLEPGSGAYNIPAALRLEGALDVAALERALSSIVLRHGSLRTVFRSESGQPVGHRLDAFPALWQIDLSLISEREGEALRLALEEAERPFDLSRGPLVRFGLLRLAEREHVLLLTLHHIVADGWSLGVWIRELGALYEAFAAGRPSPLAELPIQYSDFAAWQRSWLQGAVLERQVSYWRESLSDLDGDLDLPSDRPRPMTPSYRGGGERVLLDRVLVERLEDLGRRTGSTLFMTLLGSWQALLHRWSGRSRFAIGTPVAGRTRVETEDLIGLFVNTLALRAEVEGDPRFGTLLERVREGSLSAFEHQDLPFEKVVEAMSPERAMSRSPLFQAMFVLQTAPRPELSVSGLRLSGVELESTRSKFDLTLSLAPEASGGAGVSGVLEYSRDLFDRSTVARLVASWLELLDAAVGDPDLRLSELPLLSDGQRHQLQVEWNGTPSPAGQPLCLHEPFTAQAGRTPEAEAVWFAGESLSYGELESRSNRLAHRLRAFGVGPEVRVGVCLERTPALVVSLLAVLKAGGAYVPLDPRYPQTRLELMLEDSGARLAMVEETTLERLSAWSGERLVVSGREMEEGPAHPVSSGVSPRNLAYLIYTSGSTGRPKGVAIEHASAWALTMWARESFPSDCWSGVLASTSVCFDLSVFEIFVPLAWGGRLVLASDALELGGLTGAGVRLVNTVPSAMSELERLGALPSTVRVVNLAGEPLKRGLAEALYARGVEQVWNLYGPSEDTTYSTASRVAAGDVGAPTIGRPLPGTRSYVVDRELEPVPLGASGELLLGGVGLARGYLGRPELTAERFVPDLWSGVAGARLYRTGDRVRYRTDGELEFIGRLDQQVKVRGFRIELGEIESVLEELPEVREAVVVVREEASGDRRLVAYVVGEASAADLRRILLVRLPEHMVPSAFVLLDALPLTPNGKVDRRSLPAPERSAEGEHVAPQTPLELELAAIWSAVLGVERIGLHDNFFALGGHSLLATQVIARIEETLGISGIPLRSLFQKPTLGELALAVTQAEAERLDESEMRGLLAELHDLSAESMAELLQEAEP